MTPREHAIAAICPLSGEPKTVYEINMVKMLTEFAMRVRADSPSEADQRDAALEEAADRLQEEYLTDKTGDPSDDAYNRAVSDCINAVNAMRQSATSDE